MTTVAYIANQFPSPLEPYVMDEIRELRKRGVRVICCSGKHVAARGLADEEKEFYNETRFFHPLSDTQLVRAVRRLGVRKFVDLMIPAIREVQTAPRRRLRCIGRSHPRSSRILRVVDGAGRSASPKHWLQLHLARLGSFAACRPACR